MTERYLRISERERELINGCLRDIDRVRNDLEARGADFYDECERLKKGADAIYRVLNNLKS